MTAGLVSAVLVNLNCAGFAERVLRSVASQTHTAIETIVVDNWSTDGSVEWIRKRYPAVKVIELGSNRGFSAALNHGIAHSQGEFVLSLNFDVELEPQFVTALVLQLRARPDCGWAAGTMRQLRDAGPIDVIDCNGHYLLRCWHCYAYDPDRPRLDDYQMVTQIFGASGCAAMYRRSMLDDVGIDGQVFDETLFAYFEHTDLDWRAQHAGYQCLFVPAARGAHVRSGTGMSRRTEMHALPLSNRFLVMAKNDSWRDLLEDASPIARRTLADVRATLASGQTRALRLAVWRIAPHLPGMLVKRRQVRKARTGSTTPARRWRMNPHFSADPTVRNRHRSPA